MAENAMGADIGSARNTYIGIASVVKEDDR